MPEYHRVAFQSKHLQAPDGAQIIAPHKGGVSGEEETNSSVQNLSEEVKVGYFHTPKQFVSMGRCVKHPMDSVEHLEDATLSALNFNPCKDREEKEYSACKDIGQEAGQRSRAPFSYAFLSSKGAGG